MLIIQRPTVEAIDDVEGNRQRFAISPLEPGFGHTIGNSLRRTLLSSIPGAAITQVRFDEALHEFDTITGVTEDVTDVILNLKDIVVVSHSDEPVTVRLDIAGPAEVTAADIQTTADVEILNGDLHIATVNAKGRIAADLTIERVGAATCRPTPAAVRERSGSSRSMRSFRPCAGWRSRSSRSASSSRPTSIAWSSTSKPTVR